MSRAATADVQVKALMFGPVIFGFPQMPLADEGRLVTRVLQRLAKGDLRQRHKHLKLGTV